MSVSSKLKSARGIFRGTPQARRTLGWCVSSELCQADAPLLVSSTKSDVRPLDRSGEQLQGLPDVSEGEVSSVLPVLAGEAGPTFLRLVFLRTRDVTIPGASHRRGFLSEYPGHTIPAERHFAHVGRAASQTRRLREHSQQDFWSEEAGVGLGLELAVEWLSGVCFWVSICS